MLNSDDHIYNASRTLDDFVISHLQRDKLLAYLIAGLTLLYAGLVTLGLIVMLPLKQTYPLPIIVDKLTGNTQIVGKSQDIQDSTVTAVMDRYWITRYLIAREGFNPASLHRDFEFVESSTCPNIFSAYTDNFEPDRPDNYIQIYRGKQVLVEVKTINLISDLKTLDSSSIERTYTVSLDRAIQTTSGVAEQRINYQVVLQANYRQIAKEEKLVRINPLGFTVCNYTRNQFVETQT